MKIVHVHFHKASCSQEQDQYFGSLSAIYEKIDSKMLGIKLTSLRTLLKGRDAEYINNKVIIRIKEINKKKRD